jgi:hypothetical protein
MGELLHRFRDQHLRISDFWHDVDVVCPKCASHAKAIAGTDMSAKLTCVFCGYSKEEKLDHYYGSASRHFNADLWFQASFKNNILWAYSRAHLEYIEKYIGAKLREHQNRLHYTLLEKLPKFYHNAKNREALLKTISRLKQK